MLEVGTLAAGWLLGDRQLVIISWLLEKTSFKSRVKKTKKLFHSVQFSNSNWSHVLLLKGYTGVYQCILLLYINNYIGACQ